MAGTDVEAGGARGGPRRRSPNAQASQPDLLVLAGAVARRRFPIPLGWSAAPTFVAEAASRRAFSRRHSPLLARLVTKQPPFPPSCAQCDPFLGHRPG